MGKIKLFLVGFLGSIFIRVLGRTITLKESPGNYSRELEGQGEKVIYAFWHSLMLVPVYVGRNLGVKVLISQHTDGEYIAQVVQRLGHNVVRGSTTRGGCKGIVKLYKKCKRRQDLSGNNSRWSKRSQVYSATRDNFFRAEDWLSNTSSFIRPCKLLGTSKLG